MSDEEHDKDDPPVVQAPRSVLPGRLNHNEWTAVAGIITGLAAIGGMFLQACSSQVNQRQTAEQLDLTRQQIHQAQELQRRQWQEEDARRTAGFAERVSDGMYVEGKEVKLKVQNANSSPAEIWILMIPTNAAKAKNWTFQVPPCSEIGFVLPSLRERDVILRKGDKYWKPGANARTVSTDEIFAKYGVKGANNTYEMRFDPPVPEYGVSQLPVCAS